MRVALVGNQNSGKTTLFNILTGTNQKVGNWPGVTIEKKEGIIKETDIEIVDLPGIYSLSPYTAEEEVSRKYIVESKPDAIINIVDSTSLERSLYLTTQLLELDCPVVLALNMEDLLEKKGIHINEEELSKQLGVTVISVSALKGTGVSELVACLKDKKYINEIKPIYSDKVEKELATVMQFLNCENKRFAAVKLIERDALYANYHSPIVETAIAKIEGIYQTDTEEVIASLRYDYIVQVRDKTVVCSNKGTSITDKLDKIFLNRWLAIPIFAVIMFLIYYLSVGVIGSWTVDMVSGLIEGFTEWVAGLLEKINASNWIISLICDGIIAGVGAMLNFVPQLIIMFICISLLEVSGYMSRIAFFLDRLFKKFGLSGKSLIPFIVGSGCSVPGIMATRTIEDEQEKKMTILLTPFIPCSAKLPIIVLFSTYFFNDNSGLIAASLYFLAIVVILITALIMKKFIYKGDSSAFISELPEYKMPSIKYVARDVFEKIVAFIKRAGTIILICSVAVWLLLSFTWDLKYTDSDAVAIENVSISEVASNLGVQFNAEEHQVVAKVENGKVKVAILLDGELTEYQEVISDLSTLFADEKVDKRKSYSVVFDGEDGLEAKYSYGVDSSILATIGKGFSWVFYPMLGELNWAATVSAVQGLVAKEQVVASMSVIAGFGEEISEGKLIFGEGSIFSSMTQLSAYSYMVFNLFSAPCFGAIGAMGREFGSKKRMFIAILVQTGIAWALGSLIFGIGSLIGALV